MEARGPPRIKDKRAAPVQISAEQLLREAVDRQDDKLKAPMQRFADLEELHQFQGRKRKEFEDYIRRNRMNINNFLKYAEWELSQKEFRRARSIFERAIDAGHSTTVVLWIRYAQAEMKNRNINHARNVFDRAVTILPRTDKLWYQYSYLEQTLGNIEGCRSVYERWMTWEPEEAAWSSYIKLELRHGEIDRARNIFQRFTIVHPEARTWLKWAKFETENGTSDSVREVYSTAIESLGDDFMDERVIIAFSRFEASLKELERARAIYQFALDRMPRSKSVNLHKAFVKFEKQYGSKDGIQEGILSKRRKHYEDEIRENPKNYDAWIDFARLEETAGNTDRVRDVYEQAIAHIPPTQEKRLWRRYLYIWLLYAVWEETVPKDTARSRQIYQECVRLVPHKRFTFAKLWLQFARFEVRQGNLTTARKLLGQAIGMCPKDKLFKGYIELEMKLFEFTRCRQLYTKYIEWNGSNSQTWIDFARLEQGLDDLERARAIFELAIDEPQLDMPEMVWKAYIEFEEGEGEYARSRALYKRLLDKTDHVKVYISWAQFELGIPDEADVAANEDNDDAERPITDAAKARARAVFELAHKRLKEKDLKEGRVALLQAWQAFEAAQGSREDKEKIDKQMPRKVKKRRKLDDVSFEEYVDYVFPADDESAAKLAKLMANAQRWKQIKAAQEGAES